MAANSASAKKQQGELLHLTLGFISCLELKATDTVPDLQMQYSTFKNTIQQLAQKIGDVEQERDEHAYVSSQTSSSQGFISINVSAARS